MQHVKASWLKLFNFGLILLTTVLFVTYFAFENLQVPEATKAQWGITPAILVIGGVHALYTLFVYPFFNKKYTWFANVPSLAIYAMLFAAIIDTSGNVNLVYRLGYVALIFFFGLNGPFPPLAGILLTWTVFIFSQVGLTTPTKASVKFNIIIDVLLTVAGLLGWLFFKRWYVKKADKAALALESMLEQEQSKSSVMLEAITDGVMVINPKGTVQVINRSAASMLGWDQKEAMNLDFRSLFEPINETETIAMAETAINLTLKSSVAEQKVSYLKTHNNRQLYVDIVASPIFQTIRTQETGQSTKKLVGVIAVLRNVDEQKRQEQQRSDFISTASHEMRTPVASIQGFIELALNPKVATIDEKAKAYLLKAHDATRHLGELFQDLLTVSKSEDGRLANNPKLIEVRETVQEIVEQTRVSAESKGLKLMFDTSESNDKTIAPLMYVKVDPERLREIVLNLIDNAIKYTKAGMITVGVSLKDQGVVLRVSDTGLGIAEEDIPHLFQKFYRTDNTSTREIGGTGLGLFICRQIVEVMGGKIWVESTVGAGSTFYVEIPRVSSDGNQIL